MSADDNKSPPPLESDDEQDIQQAAFTESDGLSTSPSTAKAGTTATPSNTPVVSLYSKVPAQTSATKRSYEGQPVSATGDDAKVQDMLSKLAVKEVAPKKAPGKDDAENDDDDDDEDDDDDDEDGGDEEGEDEEEDYVATKEQMDAVVPLLRENQLKIDSLKEEYQKARRELEIKFQESRKEHYRERATIVHGENDDNPLPGFWLDAMQRSMLLSQFIEEHDEPALIFLDNVECNELTDDFGYQLLFHFAKNPFFTNSTLTKTLKLSNLYSSDYVMPNIDDSIGCEINWLPEKNLTVRVEVKEVKRAGGKRGGKKGGATKEVRQEVPQPSFFQFFGTRVDKTPEELQEMGEEEQEAYQQEWEMDFAISATIRSKLIPDTLRWYLGEAQDSEYEDDEEDEDEEDGEFDEMDEDDEDDDDDDDEDDDEEDQAPPKGKKGGKGKPLASQAAPGKEGEAPECKQQ